MATSRPGKVTLACAKLHHTFEFTVAINLIQQTVRLKMQTTAIEMFHSILAVAKYYARL